MSLKDQNTPGLYVHIPFCLSRCSYCAFVSTVYREDAADSYLNALQNEFISRELHSASRRSYRPSTLFIGGGTPSALSEKQIKKLMAFVSLPVNGGEATCEMNPDSATYDKLKLLFDAGINRCSFGVQTFSQAGLELLQRRHDGETAVKAVEMALAIGFSAVNVDLIMGWPGEEIADLWHDLNIVSTLGVQHVSCYNLMLEPGSNIHKRIKDNGLVETDDEASRLFLDHAGTVLAERGFVHYETSNYAKPGHECRHNSAIWKGGEYHGVGASAHSHIAGRRFANVPDVEKYIAGGGLDGEVFSEKLDGEEKARECAVFWLRLFEGIRYREFEEKTGYSFRSLYAGILPELLEKGYLVQANDGCSIRVPEKYHAVLDSILVDLV